MKPVNDSSQKNKMVKQPKNSYLILGNVNVNNSQMDLVNNDTIETIAGDNQETQ